MFKGFAFEIILNMNFRASLFQVIVRKCFILKHSDKSKAPAKARRSEERRHQSEPRSYAHE